MKTSKKIADGLEELSAENPQGGVTEKKKERASPTRNPHYEIAWLKTERSRLKDRALKLKTKYEEEHKSATDRLAAIDAEILEAETRAESTNQESLLP